MKDECGMMNEERLEARYTSASEHVERLTPSLLAKAFRGELVSQEE
jgi:type I restriction enzyme, S subunit